MLWMYAAFISSVTQQLFHSIFVMFYHLKTCALNKVDVVFKKNLVWCPLIRIKDGFFFLIYAFHIVCNSSVVHTLISDVMRPGSCSVCIGYVLQQL